MPKLRFTVVIEKDEDGYFAFCPELQGCYTQGDTYEEVGYVEFLGVQGALPPAGGSGVSWNRHSCLFRCRQECLHHPSLSPAE